MIFFIHAHLLLRRTPAQFIIGLSPVLDFMRTLGQKRIL